MSALRRSIRNVIDRVSVASGALSRSEQRMLSGLTVLMYHRVLPAEVCLSYPLRSLAMPIEAFREQAAWLAEHARVVIVSEGLRLLESCEAGGDGERPLVSITFDDGYADNLAAAEILEANGIRGVFFVTTGFIAGEAPLWFDVAALGWSRLGAERAVKCADMQKVSAQTLPEWMGVLKRLRPAERAAVADALRHELGMGARIEGYKAMTPDDVRQLSARGHEIGSHTVTHPLLPQLDEVALSEELRESMRVIEQWTGSALRGIAYPNGDHDERTTEACARAGYVWGCTTAPGLNEPGIDPFRVRRLDMTPGRVTTAAGGHDALGFRAEVSRAREVWR